MKSLFHTSKGNQLSIIPQKDVRSRRAGVLAMIEAYLLSAYSVGKSP